MITKPRRVRTQVPFFVPRTMNCFCVKWYQDTLDPFLEDPQLCISDEGER